MKGSKPTNRELKQQRLLAKEIKKQEKLQLNKDLSQIRRQEYAMTKRQEEAELFQFCRPAVKTKKEGKGKSVIEKGPNLWTQHMLTEVSLAAYIFKRTRLSMSMSAYSSTQNHSTFVTD